MFHCLCPVNTLQQNRNNMYALLLWYSCGFERNQRPRLCKVANDLEYDNFLETVP